MSKWKRSHKAFGDVYLVGNIRFLLWFLIMGLLIMAPFSLSAEPNKLTPSILSETFSVYDECYYSEQSSFYNCDCIATKFIDARVKNSAGNDIDIFINRAQSQCIDTSPVAGSYYQDCLQDGILSGTHEQREAFCSCVGREMGKEFTRKLVNQSTINRINIITKVYGACGFSRMVDIPQS
jgi:hypothetical protein